MADIVFSGVGHGGNDGGASANGLKESDINLVMAQACHEVLVAHGVPNPMSRTTDENDPVEEEIREANASGARFAIAFHNNAGGGDGCEIFHSIKGGDGKVLAQNIEAELKAIGQNSRGVKTRVGNGGSDYYAFIRETTMHAVIVESFFLDSDDRFIADTVEKQRKFGVAIAKGILKTLGIAYNGGGSTPTPPVKPPVNPPSGMDREITRYKENGKCTITARSGIIFRDSPSTANGKKQGTYSYGEYVYYDLVVLTEHYVWISWIGASSGTRRYMPIVDKRANQRWGDCV